MLVLGQLRLVHAHAHRALSLGPLGVVRDPGRADVEDFGVGREGDSVVVYRGEKREGGRGEMDGRGRRRPNSESSNSQQ